MNLKHDRSEHFLHFVIIFNVGNNRIFEVFGNLVKRLFETLTFPSFLNVSIATKDDGFIELSHHVNAF